MTPGVRSHSRLLHDTSSLNALEAECGLTPTPLRYLMEHDAKLFVSRAEEGGQLVGCITAVFVPPAHAELRVLSLAVREQARVRRIGRHLVKRAIRKAQESGCEMVTMECRLANKVVQRLAEFFGGTLVKIKRKFYPNGDDAWVYALSLPKGDSHAVQREEEEGKGQVG